MTLSRHTFLLLGCCCYFIVPAQEYRLDIRHIGMEDGLSNEFVNDIAQDENGFIWFSTTYGLCRYDGYEMQTYTAGSGPISNNLVVSSIPLQDNILLVNYLLPAYDGTSSRKFDILNTHTKETIDFKDAFPNAPPPFETEDISFLQIIDRGTIWVITQARQVYIYDGSWDLHETLSEKFQSLMWEVREPPHFISDGMTLWVKPGTGGEPNIFFQLDETKDITGITTLDDVFFPILERGDTMWVFSELNEKEVWYKPPASGFQKIDLQLKQEDITTVYRPGLAIDKDNRIWVINRNFLYVFNRSGELLYKHQEKSGAYYTDILVDKGGNTWVASTKGVYIFTLEQQYFTNYYYDEPQDARGIATDEAGRIYYGDGYHFLINGKITALGSGIGICKSGEEIWVGSYGREVLLYNTRTQKYKRFVWVDTMGNLQTGILLPYKSRTNRIWGGTERGLAYFDSRDSTFLSFTRYNEFQKLKNSSIRAFYENREGIWLSTSTGLYLLDEEQGIVDRFGQEWPVEFINYVYEDQEGIFWIATQGGGLIRWNRKTNEWTQFGLKDGLSHEVIYAVYEDDYGYLWLPSNYGLMQFDKETHFIINYLEEDGLPHHEFNWSSHHQAPDGRLFFGGLGGVTSFHPKDLSNKKTSNTPLLITSFEKMDANTGELTNVTAELLESGKIVLTPDEKSFTLSFTFLNYQDPYYNRFAYQLENLETGWYHTKDNFIRITGLPYGKYTLHIKAKEAGGQWSSSQLMIPVTVQKPVYLEWWFIALLGIAIGSIAAGIIAWNIQRLKRSEQRLQREVEKQTRQILYDKQIIEKQAEELKELDEAKSRFFVNVSHEIRTPLTLILHPLQQLLRDRATKDKEKMVGIEKNAQKLLELVEEILTLSKLETAQLQLEEEPVALHAFIQQLFHSFDSYAALHQIQYQLNYQATPGLHLLLDKTKFSKIINNLLSNALKFTPAEGEVILTVQEQGKQLVIKVCDTGIGIPAEDLPRIFDRYFQVKHTAKQNPGGTGIGLAMAKEYATLMRGNLTVTSQPEVGSTFCFTFPKKEIISVNQQEDFKIEKSIAPVFTLPMEKPKFSPNKNTILIVEDNPDIQKLVGEVLQSDYNLLFAAHGKEALQQLTTNNQQLIDLIITDLMMPEMDGFTLLEHLKAKKKWQSIPVIVLTARVNYSDKLKALRIGVDDYIVKPFHEEELLVQVQNLIRNYKNRQKFFQEAKETEEEVDNSITLSLADQKWLKNVELVCLELIADDPFFQLSDLTSLLNISERQFRRKIQQFTGLNPSDYLREIRLQKARTLLQEKVFSTVSEVAYAVGVSSLSHFSKIFMERFGKLPSDIF